MHFVDNTELDKQNVYMKYIIKSFMKLNDLMHVITVNQLRTCFLSITFVIETLILFLVIYIKYRLNN